MVVMKGNHGKGARRKLLQKLYVVIAILSVTCLVLYSLLPGKDGAITTANGRRRLPDALNPRRGLIKNKKQQRKGQAARPPPRKEQGSLFRKKRLLQPHHHGGGTPAQNEQQDADQAWDDVMNARLHLVELHGVGSKPISELTAEFCRLDWHLHKEQPATYPMFRDLVSGSPGCADDDQKVFFNFREVVMAARSYDEASDGTVVNVLEMPAVVFHESRCGSTLTANLLATWHPPQHRVYSESSPPIQALQRVCGENYDRCSVETAAAIFKDVIYLMSRSDDRREERVFFKFQSAGTRNIEVFQTAFPDTPYLFVYRDPVQVMMSQLARGVKTANCLQTQSNPSHIIRRILQKYGMNTTPEDYCAAHLASITERVMDSYTDYAIPINYRDMPTILFDTVFPQLLNEGPLAEADLRRMKETANVYSKGRGGATHEFAGDSEQKEAAANERVRAASERYLKSSYDRLEQKAALVLATAQQRRRQQGQRPPGGGQQQQLKHRYDDGEEEGSGEEEEEDQET
jgi:hypothetical protein